MITRETAAQREEPKRGMTVAERFRGLLPFVCILAVAAILFTIRLSAPPNFLDQDQERPAAYVLDVVKNGNWLCQRDLSGDIASKPPIYPWLSAGLTLAVGRVNAFTLYLPGALAGLGVAWLIWAVGRTNFGARAAFIGAIAFMLTTAGAKQFGLARTDGVFTFMVAAGAVTAFRSWRLGKGWVWFWLAGAAATLTKGPLGVVLAGLGLLACWWERRTGEPMPLRGSHWPGIALFLAIAGGWFLLAYLQFGQALVAKMIGKELVGHAVKTTGGNYPGMLVYQQSLYYLGRGVPWSLLAYYGLWRIWRRPAAEATERRFERFLFCWFVGGLLIFSIAPHQRADLLWPLMPAAALIAGRELDRLAQRMRPALFSLYFGVCVVLGLAGFAYYYFGVKSHDPTVRQTVALKNLAKEVEQRGGREFPLTHVDDPMTLQIYLNTLRPRISTERAVELLRGREAAFVTVNDTGKLEMARRAEDPAIYKVVQVSGDLGKKHTWILGNRPNLNQSEPMAFCFTPFFIRYSNLQLLRATEDEFCFSDSEKHGEVTVVNESTTPRRVRVRVMLKERQIREERILGSQEVWRVVTSSEP